MQTVLRAARSRPSSLSPRFVSSSIKATVSFRSFHKHVPLNSTEAAPVASEARYETPYQASLIEDIAKRRLDAGKLVAGVAAASNSEMFKGLTDGMPKAKRWDSHLTAESLARKPCTLKLAAKHLKQPGLISLGGGLPSSQVFPFSEIGMKVPVVPHFSEKDTTEQGQDITIGKYDVRDRGQEYDLSIALNYGQSNGSAQMMRFLTEHTEIVCRPPYADWQVCQTIGSTGALEQALRMFCDKDRGDSVLTETFSFSTALETIEPLGVKIFGSIVDDQGLIPEAMDQLLSDWDAGSRGARKPHVLYTVPSGQNPTGATQGAQRRREIYKICQKHDIFIIEDEPYYFLQMEPYSSSSQPSAAPSADVEEFVSSLIPPYVSFDTDGRVMRLDSFSKVLVPGSRLGWIVASEQVVERYQRHAEVASQGPSGFSQVILHKLLDQTWGHEGYLRWLMNLRLEYTNKRNALLTACEEYLPSDIVFWNPPVAGMFLWFSVDYSKHPKAQNMSMEAVEEEIFNSCIGNGVLVARGSWFLAEKDKPLPGLHFRATFATASQEQMSAAISRFGKAVCDSFGR